MTIEIVKWNEFNPKEVRKTPYWFRVNINVASSQSLFGLSFVTKWTWICLLAEAMRHKKGTFSLATKWASQHWEIRHCDLLKAIHQLHKNGLIKICSEETRSELGPDSEETRLYKTIQDKTIQDNITSKLDFEPLYQKYPRKLGKADGLAKCERQITTHEEYLKLSEAIERFTAYHRSKKTEEKYIPYFSTFMTDWQSWLDPTTGTVSPEVIPKKKSISEMILENSNGSKAV